MGYAMGVMRRGAWQAIREVLLLWLSISSVLGILMMPTPAKAQDLYRIKNDRGGQIGVYLKRFAALRTTGKQVLIDGDCLSACTLALGMIPRKHLTVASNARLGFHAAWLPDEDGQPVTSRPGTRFLWDAYPRVIQRWIAQNGGLTRQMIYLSGATYNQLYAQAARHHTRAHAHTHLRTASTTR